MPNVRLTINSKTPFGRFNNLDLDARQRKLLNWIEQNIAGYAQSDGLSLSVDDALSASQACAALVGSGLAAAVGATIGGALVTVVAAGGDVATQTLLVAAIRAAATVNRKVSATNFVAQLTMSAVAAGTTVTIGGFVFTAVTGASTNNYEFTRGVSTAADAASLAASINRSPGTCMRMAAVSTAAGIVYVAPLIAPRPQSQFDDQKIRNPSAGTIVVNVSQPVASAVTIVFCCTPSEIGNECRLTASGTGMTAVTNGAAGFLGGGQGGGQPVIVIP